MRCCPTFSESSFSLSFFLTTPAKKPRTECGCQPVASTIAATVVPLARASIESTISCFEDEPLTGFAEAFAVAFDSGFGDFGFSAAVVACLLRADFVMRFAFFDVFLLMAISGPPSCQRQLHVLPLTQAPRAGRARGQGGAATPGSLREPRAGRPTTAPIGTEV